MRILAIDTSTDISSLAVATDTGMLAEYNSAHRMDLSRRLMPNILAVLADCGLGVKDLDAIGVSLGPGSFTGLRIGVVTAKTLAQVLGVPIAGIVSLDLLAYQFAYLPDGLICPVIKVRKGEVYYAFYRTGGSTIERISEYEAAPVEKLTEHFRTLDAPRVILAGDGISPNVDQMREGFGDAAIITPEWLSHPKASIIARLAAEKIARGESDDTLALSPFYIRRSAPEMRLETTCY